ncbi:hypothetical protein RN001_010069 [Aquatica leii]|uniref:Uncharacterized protein n=1 Tax=Aquatica leii TaxID=1421715 RepID=A0AAN7QH80_9COLE|nr:hypothetical protein RN001_010069 [Aquatica leii]
MKTIIILLILSVFVLHINALSNNAVAFENRAQIQLGDLLKPILECLMNNLSALSKEDLSYILDKLKEILLKLGGCLNIDVGNATQADLLTLIQCLIDKLGQASKEELSDIVKQLQPVLTKVQNILNCIRDVLKKLCNGLCNIPGITLCGSTVLGVDLLQLLLQILNPIVALLFCNVLG